MARIIRSTLLVGLAAVVMTVGLPVAPAQAGAESSMVSKINSARSSRGLEPLQVYWDLSDDARAQAKRMRDRQEVFHHPNLGSVTGGWTRLGENVAAGTSISLIFDAFMASSNHRSNVLGSYNYVGVGVAEDANSILWVSVIFMLGPDDLLDPPATTTTTTTTQPPNTTTTTQPPSTTTTTQPPSTTTTTQQPGGTTTTTHPPSGTTTTVPPGGTTTTTQPPDGGDPIPGGTVWLLSISESEYAALIEGWLDPSLLRSDALRLS